MSSYDPPPGSGTTPAIGGQPTRPSPSLPTGSASGSTAADPTVKMRPEPRLERGRRRRPFTETKHSTKTSELVAYVVTVVVVLITALVVGTDVDGNPDPFSAERAMTLFTFLTIGYMLARGLAKSGSREPYEDDDEI